MQYKNISEETLSLETAVGVERVEPGAVVAIAPARAKHYLDCGLLAAFEPTPEPTPSRRKETKE